MTQQFWTTLIVSLITGGGLLKLLEFLYKSISDMADKRQRKAADSSTYEHSQQMQMHEQQKTVYLVQQNLLDDLNETIKRLEDKNSVLEQRMVQQQEMSEQRFSAQRTRIEQLITRIDEIQQENIQLKLTNIRLTNRVVELETELNKFNNRVYYIPKKENNDA